MGHWAIFGGGIFSARLFPSKSHLYVPSHRALLSHRAGSMGLQDAFNFIRKAIKAREKWEKEDESNMLREGCSELINHIDLSQKERQRLVTFSCLGLSNQHLFRGSGSLSEAQSSAMKPRT